MKKNGYEGSIEITKRLYAPYKLMYAFVCFMCGILFFGIVLGIRKWGKVLWDWDWNQFDLWDWGGIICIAGGLFCVCLLILIFGVQAWVSKFDGKIREYNMMPSERAKIKEQNAYLKAVRKGQIDSPEMELEGKI